MNNVTIIDALEGLLDGELCGERVRSFSNIELENFIMEIVRFYDARQTNLPPSTESNIRCFAGGYRPNIEINTFFPPHHQYLLSSLLYADQVVIDCGFAMFCRLEAVYRMHRRPGMDLEGPDDDYARTLFAHLVDSYSAIAKLVKAGYIVPTPAAHESEEDWTGTSNPWFELCDLGRSLEKLRVGQSRNRAFDGLNTSDIGIDVAWGLSRANDHSGRFLPALAIQAGYYFDALQSMGDTLSEAGIDSRVASGVVGAGLPLFGELNQDDILAIRQSEESFEVWRSTLREAIRTIEASPSDIATFASDAREVLLDRLTIASGGVTTAVERSKALRESVTERSLDAGISAVAASIGAAAVGASVAPSVLGGVVASAGLRLLYESIFRRPQQTQGVAIYLAQRLPN